MFILYVDNMLIVGQETKKIPSLKNASSKILFNEGFGDNKTNICMKISRDRESKKFWMSQEKLIQKNY